MTKPRILVVEDERININILVNILMDDYEVVIAKNGEQAIKRVQEQLPDLILLDIMLPDMDGYSIFEQVQNISTDKIPVIFVTSKRSADEETHGLKLGAVDYITKPFTPSIVQVRVANQIEAKMNRDELKRLNLTDALTGLSNRRHMTEYIDSQLAFLARSKAVLSVIMIDIDHFKEYNDHYGHSAGDDCLKHVAQALKSKVVRTTDFIARYGGEEFIAILPATELTGATHFASELRNTIHSLQIRHEASNVSTMVTISLGIASTCFDNDNGSINSLLDKADAALYKAKQDGRDRYCVSTD